MDTIQHTAHGFLINETVFALTDYRALEYSFEITFTIAILYGTNIFLSVLPDLAGWLEKVRTGNKNAWNWYHDFHKIHPDNPVFYAPGGLLHIVLDKHLHGSNRWWVWNEGLIWEILGWILTIVWGGLLFL